MFYQLQARREEQLKKEEEERKMREEKYGNASPSVSGRETNPDPGTRCHISKQIKINYDISHLLYNLLSSHIHITSKLSCFLILYFVIHSESGIYSTLRSSIRDPKDSLDPMVKNMLTECAR